MEKQGLVKITDMEYFSRSELSNSDLSKLLQSPKAYKFNKDFGGQEQTPSMMLGSLVHGMYLEPDVFDQSFVKGVVVDRRTKAGKEEWASFMSRNENKKVVTPEVWDHALRIYDGLMMSVGPMDKLAKGRPELAAFWEWNGVKCRAKMDWLADDGYVWDLKTTKSLRDFARSVANFGYHRQDPFYQRAVKQITGECRGFKFIAVENKEPYDAAIFVIDDMARAKGLYEIEKGLETYKKCMETNVWPGAFESDKEVLLSLPKWYYGVDDGVMEDIHDEEKAETYSGD